MFMGVVALRRAKLHLLPHRCGFALVAALWGIVGFAGVAMAQTPFYRAPPSVVAGAPGTLVRQEPIDGAPLGAAAYRVLYRSTGLDDKPILVSGIVIVPQGPPPPGGRPIVPGHIRLPESCRAARLRLRSLSSSRSRVCAPWSSAATSSRRRIIRG